MAEEKKVVEGLIKQLSDISALVLRVTNILGCPDLILCYNGHFIGIECKDDKTGPYKRTRAQEMFERIIRKAGGEYYLADKYNLLDVIESIKTLQPL